MKIYIWKVVLLFTLGIVSVQGAKEMGPKAKIPDDKLFQDPSAFCEGCYGLVHEMDKLLSIWSNEKGSMEDHIEAAMLAVCSTERLRAYVLSPPKMERLCSGIRAHYEDELALAFLKSYGQKNQHIDKVFEETCRKVIPACPKHIKPMSVARKEQREKEEAERAAKETPSEKEKKEQREKEEGERAAKETSSEKERKNQGNKKEQGKKGGKNQDKKSKKEKSKHRKKSNAENKKDEL